MQRATPPIIFLRIARYGAWIGVVVLLAVVTWSYFAPEKRVLRDERYQLGGPISEIGGPFTLIDHNGRTVTENEFAGRPTLVFFGFTSCPDVCPTALWNVTELLRQVGDDARDLRVLFISVDPERDTPAKMKDYVSNFDARVVGLTGTLEQVAASAKAYRAYFKKVVQEGGNYTMDHTATVYMMDRNGKFRGTIDVHQAKDASLAKLRRLISERGVAE